MCKTLLAVTASICLLLCGCAQKFEYSKSIFAMDTVMDLTIYSENENALSEAEAEIRRIESLLDRGNENSDIYKINNNKSTVISEETAEIIRSSLSISEKTDGAFDITIAPVMDLWGFYGSKFRVPSHDELQTALSGVGYEKIQLDGNNISIPQNTCIDLGGIGKGYTSDRVTSMLKDNGITSAIISLGGNVHAIGKKSSGEDWVVGITDPHNKSQLIGKIRISDSAVITSGGYQRCFEQDGIKYHHIIDPKNGKSADSGLASVTVISGSGAHADALSTALFVMGLDKGLEFWRDNRDFDAVFVDDNGQIYITDGISDIFESDYGYTICR